jgi:hypothetical protein
MGARDRPPSQRPAAAPPGQKPRPSLPQERRPPRHGENPWLPVPRPPRHGENPSLPVPRPPRHGENPWLPVPTTPPAWRTAAAARAPRTPDIRSPSDVVRSICDDAWLSGLAARGAKAVSEPVWRQAEAAWGGEVCRWFEGMADTLEKSVEMIHTGLGALAGELALVMGAPPWAATLIRWVVSSVTLPYERPVQAAAQAIRVLGIALCAEQDDLGQCACLVGFAHAESDELVADRLAEGFHALAG